MSTHKHKSDRKLEETTLDCGWAVISANPVNQKLNLGHKWICKIKISGMQMAFNRPLKQSLLLTNWETGRESRL